MPSVNGDKGMRDHLLMGRVEANPFAAAKYQ
jgi:hypothetical protein